MEAFEYTLKDPLGLHARPAGLLVKEAKKFQSKITVVFEDKSADALRMMAVMRLATRGGNTVCVTVEGEDEKSAVKAMREFFEQNV